jgi:hypothetical protein
MELLCWIALILITINESFALVEEIRLHKMDNMANKIINKIEKERKDEK